MSVKPVNIQIAVRLLLSYEICAILIDIIKSAQKFKTQAFIGCSCVCVKLQVSAGNNPHRGKVKSIGKMLFLLEGNGQLFSKSERLCAFSIILMFVKSQLLVPFKCSTALKSYLYPFCDVSQA